MTKNEVNILLTKFKDMYNNWGKPYEHIGKNMDTPIHMCKFFKGENAVCFSYEDHLHIDGRFITLWLGSNNLNIDSYKLGLFILNNYKEE